MSFLDSEKQCCKAVLVSMIDVSAVLLCEATHHRQVPMHRCDHNGSGTSMRCLIDVSAEILEKASHDIDVPRLRGDVQRSYAFSICFVADCAKSLD
jgi:hypothetical protein